MEVAMGGGANRNIARQHVQCDDGRRLWPSGVGLSLKPPLRYGFSRCLRKAGGGFGRCFFKNTRVAEFDLHRNSLLYPVVNLAFT